MFCFTCKADSPKVLMKKKTGTMVTVQQHCKNCPVGFSWRSQPLMMGTYPPGNILLSFTILMAGASISKILLIFKHFGMHVYEARTFFYHQSKFIFPAILRHWESSVGIDIILKATKNLCGLEWKIQFHGTFCKVWGVLNDVFTIK